MSIVMILLLFVVASIPSVSSLERPEVEYRIFQFPSNMIPCIDGKTDDWNIVPDMLTMSKAQVCGYLPFATLAISGEVFEVLRGKNLPAGSSECGNPVCCAVASKVLDIMEECT